jgi:hypothetical protein
MRSSPPLQLALVLLGFILLAWPLIRLTSALPRQVDEVQAPVKNEGKLHSLLRVRYAHAPSKISLKHGAVELLPAGGYEAEVELPFPKEGLELILSAQWPDGTPDTALTVELEPDGMDAQSQTRWSAAAVVDEVILFSGPKL